MTNNREDIGTRLALRQGDILSIGAQARQQQPFQCTEAVVLTADCDIANDKHYGQILLCPVVSSGLYFNEIWFPRRLELRRDKLLRAVAESFGRLATAQGYSSPDLRIVRASLDCDDSLNSALDALGVSDPKERGRLQAIQRAFVHCLDATLGPRERWAIVGQIGASEAGRHYEKLISEFHSALDQDSVDVVVFPNESRGSEPLRVALLRCPFSVQINDIASGNSRDQAAPFTHTESLPAVLKFLIAQKFGFLFSRIGMPAALESDRRAAIDLLKE